MWCIQYYSVTTNFNNYAQVLTHHVFSNLDAVFVTDYEVIAVAFVYCIHQLTNWFRIFNKYSLDITASELYGELAWRVTRLPTTRKENLLLIKCRHSHLNMDAKRMYWQIYMPGCWKLKSCPSKICNQRHSIFLHHHHHQRINKQGNDVVTGAWPNNLFKA